MIFAFNHLLGRRLCFLATLTAISVISLGAPCAQVEVKAQKLSIDSKARSALFEGNVRATYGDITLECETMKVSYSQEGTVTNMSALGSVRVVRGDAVAVAGRANLDAVRNVIVLEGSPRLRKGAHVLEGKKVVVHLGSGKMEVTEAVGVFMLGKSDGQ